MGGLRNLITNQGISGITSKPAILEKPLAGSVIYHADIEVKIRARLPTYKIIDANLKKGVDDINQETKLQASRGKVARSGLSRANASAKIADHEYKKQIQSAQWQEIAAKVAKVKPPLWASTSTKDPSYSDVMDVDASIYQQPQSRLVLTTAMLPASKTPTSISMQ